LRNTFLEIHFDKYIFRNTFWEIHFENYRNTEIDNTFRYSIFSVTWRSRSDSGHSVTQSLSHWVRVSRLDWCDSGEWGCLLEIWQMWLWWEIHFEKYILRNTFWEIRFEKYVLRNSFWEIHFEKNVEDAF